MNNDITKEEINNLDQIKFEGKVHLIIDDKSYKKAITSLRKSKTLGFDTETRPSFKKGEHHDVAILQLANEENAYIFRLNMYKLPSEVIDILSNEKVTKVGGAIERDIKELQDLYHFEPRGFIELQKLARKKCIKKVGLRNLTAILLNRRLSKGSRLTNWEKENLNDIQINYAATDAWIGLKLYNKLTLVS